METQQQKVKDLDNLWNKIQAHKKMFNIISHGGNENDSTPFVTAGIQRIDNSE